MCVRVCVCACLMKHKCYTRCDLIKWKATIIKRDRLFLHPTHRPIAIKSPFSSQYSVPGGHQGHWTLSWPPTKTYTDTHAQIQLICLLIWMTFAFQLLSVCVCLNLLILNPRCVMSHEINCITFDKSLQLKNKTLQAALFQENNQQRGDVMEAESLLPPRSWLFFREQHVLKWFTFYLSVYSYI